jgi:hypothetical protein
MPPPPLRPYPVEYNFDRCIYLLLVLYFPTDKPHPNTEYFIVTQMLLTNPNPPAHSEHLSNSH